MMGFGAGKSLQSRAEANSASQQKSGITLHDSERMLGLSKAEAAAARRQDVKTPAKKSKPSVKAAKPVVKAKAATKPAVKPVAKANAKKPAGKPSSKPAVKALAKKAAVKATSKAKPVAKQPSKKVTAKPIAKSVPKKPMPALSKSASKTTSKKATQPQPTTTSKAAAKPVAKVPTKAQVKAAAKPAAKPIAKAPIKPVAKTPVKSVAQPPAKPIPKKPETKSIAPTKVPVKPAPVPATTKPAAPPPQPVKTKAGSRVVPSYAPLASDMTPHSGNTAAKASFIMSAPVLAPPPQVVIKKDPKLVNNWKTKSADQLTDAEVIAMPDSEYMNAKQLAFFRLKLVALKNGILSNAGETTEHLREDTSVVPDPADRATIEEEHALELRTRDRERKLLKKIEQSISSIDADEYGFCDETGEPIGVARLIARPTATLSLEAQQRRELKQKMFGD
jgi:DnaK suppressor protein